MDKIDRSHDHKSRDLKSNDLGITIAFLFGISSVKRIGV